MDKQTDNKQLSDQSEGPSAGSGQGSNTDNQGTKLRDKDEEKQRLIDNKEKENDTADVSE